MIYEFFGLPGSGKSTVCSMMRKKGYQDLLFFYKNNIFGKMIFHLKFYLFKMNRKNRELFKNIEEIIPVNCRNSIFVKNTTIDFYIKYLVLISRLEKKSIGNNCIDEGIVHYLMALYAEFNVNIDILNKIMVAIGFPTDFVKSIGINCSVQDAYYRICKRNRKQTGIDFLNKDEMIDLLNRYFEIYKYFSLSFQCKDFDCFINDGGICDEI